MNILEGKVSVTVCVCGGGAEKKANEISGKLRVKHSEECFPNHLKNSG